ncbi:MAG: hypothetical protein JRG80_03405 [Deltaproteobacteria bacterium]|nr:hypothetical protein [Deltaproteobacteria bacterium]
MTTSIEQPISNFLENVHLAPTQMGKSLSLWPLVLNDAITVPEGPDYVARNTALARGTLQIDEVADSRAPRQVRVSNTGSVATLFLFGEKVLGTENRIANASFLISANGEAVLDVSCSEAKRCAESWSACIQRNDEVISLSPYERMSEWVRSCPFATRTGGLSNLIDLYPDQTTNMDREAIHSAPRKRWWPSGQHAASASSPPRSGASDSDRHEFFPESPGEAFHPIARQIGFVACIGGRVVGVEAIGRPDVFRSYFTAMLRNYAIDARMESERDHPESAGGTRFEAPEEFLEALAGTEVNRGCSRGIGNDYRIEGDLVAGSALANEGLVHLTALPT